MKKIILSANLLICSPFLLADTSSDLQLTGDQLYEDGFTSMAWKKYISAFNSTQDKKAQTQLLFKISKTAVPALKQNESINLLNKFITDKKPEMLTANSLKLETALLYQNIDKFKESYSLCLDILKDIEKLPKELQEKTLETVIFSYIKDSKLEEASKLIEKYRDSFKSPEVIDLQNARLKILMAQFVSALSILGKYADSKDAFPQFLSLWAYMKSGDTGKAHDIFNKYLKDIQSSPDPAFTAILIKLAESTFKEQIDNATAVLDKAYAIEANPDMKAYILLKKAELLIQADKDENAVTTLEQYSTEFPKSNKILDVHLQLADLYYRSDKQDLTKSATLLNAIVDVNPQDKKMMYSALILRAEVKQAVGTLVDSAGDFTAAAQLAQKEKLTADEIAYPLYRAGLVKYLEADKIDLKEAFNDASNSFYSAGSIKSSYRIQAALMQIQALRKAESYTTAVQMLKNWLKIFPKNADLNYLLGICLIEDSKAEEGIKALKKFINLYKTDQRVPMAYVFALDASIYNANAVKMVKESEKLIIDFEQEEKNNKSLSQAYKLASPYIQHLKAIFAWKNNYKVVAESLWTGFLKNNPDHPLASEAYLWLAFKARNSDNKDFNQAIVKYEAALASLQDSSLKGYTLIQLGKSYRTQFKFNKALESLLSAIAVYRKLKPTDSLNEEFSTLLFYAGDLFARIGEYETKAIPLFEEAEKLTVDLNVKSALKGRITDCYFASASMISGQDEHVAKYQETLKKAQAIYKEIHLDSNSAKFISEQALYKLAKCHETIGNLKEKSHQNKDLDDARRYYEKIFFDYQNDAKKGKGRNSYYFLRAGYDLARLHLNFEEQGILPAITTYKILSQSGLPGTMEAKYMGEYLTSVQKKIDR
ncbi:MAG: tetratricopeptide repeat protein [Lentisphaeraceae bacterium]|nr:tetratricopeptide repeat protein [Lentisphaeraceae bacterium]